MDAACTAHKFIQRKRPVPPHIAAKLARVELDSMLTEPREQVLKAMRVVTCGKMLRGPAEFLEQLDREKPLVGPGNFTARIIMWYLAEWNPADVRGIFEMIARDTRCGHLLSPRVQKIIHGVHTRALFDFVHVIVKLDINSALAFSYREEVSVDAINTADELNVAAAIAVEYVIHSVVARGIFVDSRELAYTRAFCLFRNILVKLAAC